MSNPLINRIGLADLPLSE